MPTSLHIPGCLALGEWSHHCDYLSWRFFLYSSSVYSCHLFLIPSASLRSLPFLSFRAHLCMKCSVGISDFLEEISGLSHSIVFLYFFALIAEERLSYLSLLFFGTLCSNGYLLFASLLFTAICRTSSDSHFAFLHFFFLGMVLIPVSCTVSQTSIHSSWGPLSDLVP